MPPLGRTTFGPVEAATRARIEERAQAIGRLLREIGHARSFTLDTDELVQRRAAFVRDLASAGKGRLARGGNAGAGAGALRRRTAAPRT